MKNLEDFLNRGKFPFNYEQQLFDTEQDFLKRMFAGEILPPMHFEFLPTEKCNNNCIWCRGGHRNFMSSESELPEDILLRVMDELADYQVPGIVRFSGMSGEPTMNPGTLKAIIRGTDQNLHLGLISNGILLNADSHESLIDTTYVSVSLDAASKETFNQLKGHTTDVFYDIVGNIRSLADFKHRNDLQFRLSVGFVLHPGNYHEIFEAAKIIKDTGADIIQYKVAISPKGDIKFDPIQIEQIYELINKAVDLSDPSFNVMPMQTVEEGERELSGILPSPSFRRCYAQYFNSVVDAKGDVYICVHYYYNRERDETSITGKPIGNVKEQTFQQIWEGDTRKAIIDNIDPVRDCCFCNRYDNRINRFLGFLAKNQYLLDETILSLGEK